MRVLLDECHPRKLKFDVRADFVRTVPEMGWASIENGALLRLAESGFDVFLTRDRNLEYQQNLDFRFGHSCHGCAYERYRRLEAANGCSQ
jgi:hypothetical protein